MRNGSKANNMATWSFPCEVLSNYDGDTVKISVIFPVTFRIPGLSGRDLGFNFHLNEAGELRHNTTVRLYGVDTPEMRGGTDLTKAAAQYARDEVTQFLKTGDVILVSHEWDGKYGRVIGDFYVAGQPLSEYLIERRLGVRYSGGSRVEIQQQHEHNAAWLKSQGKLDEYLE